MELAVSIKLDDVPAYCAPIGSNVPSSGFCSSDDGRSLFPPPRVDVPRAPTVDDEEVLLLLLLGASLYSVEEMH